MEFTLEQVSQILGGELVGTSNTKIHTISKIEQATSGSISFLANPKYENYIYSTNATAVIVNKDFSPRKALQTALIKVDDAYSSFTSLLEKYAEIQKLQKIGIEQPSFIGENTQLSENIYLGAFAYIGKNCQIGENVKIYPHVYIGDNSVIGDNSIIHSGVKIYESSHIGNFCTIHSGAIIGSDGFGFAPQSDGSYKSIPQLGNVVLEDFVNIGANTVVDCATMGSTVVKKGVKLDNLIQIGHNVEIDEHTVIAAQTGIAGSSKIGKFCQIGGQVGVSGHATIPNNTKIGAQAGINAIRKEGMTVLGSPAIDYKNYIKSYNIFKNLPEIQERIKKLEEKN